VLADAGNRTQLARLRKEETVQSEHLTSFISVVTSAVFEQNCYLVGKPGEPVGLIVDPGLDAEAIVSKVGQLPWKPAAILNTHGHADHIAGNELMKRHWPECPLIIGAGDAEKLVDPEGNLSAGFGIPIVSPPADKTVREGDILDLGGIRWTVWETPGHSSGHVVFVALDLAPVLVLGGDVLFAGSVGRTDFPDGDPSALIASIRSKLFTLPDDAVVLPGHGPATTIGREKRSNPFVGDGADFFA
jgi:hydroxyacylglutathione hydrolase